MELFGSGNIQYDRPNLLKIIQNAIERQVIVIGSSQCRKGSINQKFKIDSILTKLGVIFIKDMTIECCFAKCCYLIGKVYLYYTIDIFPYIIFRFYYINYIFYTYYYNYFYNIFFSIIRLKL